MRSALATVTKKQADIRARRQRSHSLSAIPPAESSDEFVPELAAVAASILYKSPLPSQAGLPVYILNAAAFPDSYEVDYDALLPYVLARLPGEDELLSGQEYEVVFFAGGQPEGATSEKKQGPGIGWYIQAYHVLSRALRKKLQKLYIVHPRTWVRVLIGVFGTIVSPKFRRKIVMANTLSSLALHMPIERLLIPPAVYLHDRKLSPDIFAPYASGRRAFGAKPALPRSIGGGESRLPRVLRETTAFILQPENIATEGIFRIPPHSILAGVLKEAYDRGQHWVVWKERSQMVVQPGMDPSLLDEVRTEDTYGVHLAASLIKTWYRELREPIFAESSYGALRYEYGDTTTAITEDSLLHLLSSASTNSPLTLVSREILSRHLLPLLAAVAGHEPQNKMNAEALGICFAMALVCGSNQLEDAKMTSIIKRILAATIEAWPQLSTTMGVDKARFERELLPPEDSKDYEDPLEHPRAQPTSAGAEKGGAGDDDGSHRIELLDTERENSDDEVPPLPPRQRAATTGQAIPPDALASIPKRKPAPPFVNPPRYSSVFDQDGFSIRGAESPIDVAPVDGFGPPKRGNWAIDGDEKKVLPDAPLYSEPGPVMDMPKRKAVSNTDSIMSSRTVSSTSTTPGQSSAQEVERDMEPGLAQALPAANNGDIEPDFPIPHSATSDSAVFRKPTWPASASRQASLQGTVNPALPSRNSIPIISHPSGNGGAPPTVPRPRAPSPGLLKRISTMEQQDNQLGETSTFKDGTLRPRPLNLKRQSVEDLRRLYEDRVSTVDGLRKATDGKRNFTQ